jgi:AcrR family transcriptional regulator
MPPRPPRRHVRPPRARLEVDARRAQLLALALQVFSRSSYDEVSIDELARTGGVSKGLLYHYFPTKRDLYVAALGHAARQLLDETDLDQGAPPDERLRRGLEAYLDFVGRHEASYAALMRGGIGSDPEVAKILETTRSTLAARILKGLPRGESSPLRRMTLRGWIGFVEAAVLDWIARREVGRERLVELFSSVLFDAVARSEELAARASPRRGRHGKV